MLLGSIFWVLLSLCQADNLHHLFIRDEAYQPSIASDFPHVLGAERVKSWMNSSADPCQDFYQYACGGFQQRYQQYKISDVLGLMQQANSMLMEQIVSPDSDKLANTTQDNQVYSLVKRYYSSCLDVSKITSRGFDPILPMALSLKKACLYSNLDFPTIMAQLHQQAMFPLFRIYYGKVEGHTPHDLRLSFYPSRAFDVSVQEIVQVLQPFVTHGVLQESDLQGTDLQEYAKWIKEIEHQTSVLIRALNQGYSRLQPDPNNFMTLDELSQSTGITWSKYTTAIGLEPVRQVYLWGGKEAWISALSSFNKAPPRSMLMYYLWRCAMAHYGKLSRDYYTLWNTLQDKAIKPNFEDEDGSDVFQQDCVGEMGIHLNYLTGHLYVKYALNETQKVAAKELVDYLYSAFAARLQQSHWMDSLTKESALMKLSSMATIIGYPDWLKNSQLVATYHSGLEFNQEEYFENAVKAEAFSNLEPSRHQIKNKALERDSVYSGYPWFLNAFHITDQVSIQINSGILQRPLFSSKNRASMNFGAVGMIVGHEITHAFDSFGVEYDYQGVKRAWSSKESTVRFDKGAMCFEQQYGAFSVEFKNASLARMSVDGSQTLAENIADNGGLNVAYDAFVSYSRAHSMDISKPLPEFNQLTDEQVFFVSFAQTWCSVDNDLKLSFDLKHDNHSPNKYRVLGTVANSPTFAKAFQCPLGTQTNPPQKCNLY